MDDGSDRIEEGQLILAADASDVLGEGRRGEGAGGDDGEAPDPSGWQRRDLLAPDGNQGLCLQCVGHGRGKPIPVHRQCPAGRQLVPIAHGQDQRAQPPHLLVQQAHGVAHGVVGAERVGADQLGQPVGPVRIGRPHRPHLVQHHRHAAPGELPGCLAAGEAAADDMDRTWHGLSVELWRQGARLVAQLIPVIQSAASGGAPRVLALVDGA